MVAFPCYADKAIASKRGPGQQFVAAIVEEKQTRDSGNHRHGLKRPSTIRRGKPIGATESLAVVR